MAFWNIIGGIFGADGVDAAVQKEVVFWTVVGGSILAVALAAAELVVAVIQRHARRKPLAPVRHQEPALPYHV